MTSILMTESAVADLDELWLYIAEHDPDAADRIIDGVGRLIGGLKEQPEMGSPRDELAPGLRCLVFKRRVLVFYRYQSEEVTVVRVLRGERFLTAGLFE